MIKISENKNLDKNYTISFLRFVAMVFIVLCHFCRYYGNEMQWWFNVGVQIFFCISGFLYANKRINSPVDFILKNARKILIPYLCFLIPTIILYFLFARECISLRNVILAVLCSETIEGIAHLWFVPYILFCYVITPYLQALADKMRTTKWYIYLVLFICVTLFGEMLSYAFGSFFSFKRYFCYIFGYLATVFLQEYKMKRFRTLVGVLAVLTLLMNIGRIYFKYIIIYSFKGFGMFEMYSHSLLGASIVFGCLIIIKNIKKNKILEWSDKYSFYVYIVHQLFILSPFSLLRVTKYVTLNYCITVVAILFSAVLLEFISGIVYRYFERNIRKLKRKVSCSEGLKSVVEHMN